MENINSNRKTPLCEVNYKATIEENLAAYDLVDKTFKASGRKARAVFFALLFAAFLVMFIIWQSGIYLLGMVICAAGAFVTLYSPKQIRQTIREALEGVKDDRHILKVYDEKITIETVIAEDEYEEGEERVSPPPTVIKLTRGSFYLLENSSIFVIAKESMRKIYDSYALPKNAFDEESLAVFREKLSVGVIDVNDLKKFEEESDRFVQQ